MCFSAPASFIAGAALTVTGVAAVRKVHHKSEIPFAMTPLFFGLQQIAEGFVWLSFKYGAPHLNSCATNTFSFFAYIFWPIFVPFALYQLEKISWRKIILSIFFLFGLGVGVYNFLMLMWFPLTSKIVHSSIVYEFSSYHSSAPLVIFLYLLTTCIGCLFSSYKTPKVLGVLVFLFAIISYEFYTIEFISVWCFFAAILSLLIYDFFAQRKLEKLLKTI